MNINKNFVPKGIDAGKYIVLSEPNGPLMDFVDVLDNVHINNTGTFPDMQDRLALTLFEKRTCEQQISTADDYYTTIDNAVFVSDKREAYFDGNLFEKGGIAAADVNNVTLNDNEFEKVRL